MTAREVDSTPWVGHSFDVAGRDWKRLASFVVRDRVKAGYRTRTQFAEALGITDRTIGNLERGQPVGSNTLAEVAIKLGWTPDSPDNILDRSGEPTPLLPDQQSDLVDDVASQAPGEAAVETYRAMSRQLNQLKAHLASDPAVESGFADYMDTLDDLSSLVLAFRRGGWRGFRAAVIEVAQSYQKQGRHLGESDSQGA